MPFPALVSKGFTALEDSQFFQDTPIIGTAIEPETDVPIVFIHSTTPVLVLIVSIVAVSSRANQET